MFYILVLSILQSVYDGLLLLLFDTKNEPVLAIDNGTNIVYNSAKQCAIKTEYKLSNTSRVDSECDVMCEDGILGIQYV